MLRRLLSYRRLRRRLMLRHLLSQRRLPRRPMRIRLRRRRCRLCRRHLLLIECRESHPQKSGSQDGGYPTRHPTGGILTTSRAASSRTETPRGRAERISGKAGIAMCRPAQTGLGRSAVGHGPDALARLRQPCDDAARGEVDKLLPENVYPIVKACRSRAPLISRPTSARLTVRFPIGHAAIARVEENRGGPT